MDHRVGPRSWSEFRGVNGEPLVTITCRCICGAEFPRYSTSSVQALLKSQNALAAHLQERQ